MTSHNGGVEAKRGFEFETQSLLNYLLLRMLEVKENIDITFEKQQDATIIYQATSARPAIIELVQCKKREKPLPDSDPSVTLDGYDPWFLGPCGRTKLDEWLRSPAGGLSIMKQLDDSSHRYTVLLFGQCQSRLQRFVPNGLGPNWRGLDYLQIPYACPVHFEHATNPDKRRHFGPPHAVKRIRILPMAGPRLLEIQSRTILEDLQTRPHACPDIVKKLLDRVRELQWPKNESNRRFSSHEATQFLIPGRFGMGRWQRRGIRWDSLRSSQPTRAARRAERASGSPCYDTRRVKPTGSRAGHWPFKPDAAPMSRPWHWPTNSAGIAWVVLARDRIYRADWSEQSV